MTAHRRGRIAVFTALVLGVTALVVPTVDAHNRGRHRVRCLGRTATIVGTNGDDVLTGTPRRDVIAARSGNDIIRGLEGNDIICAEGGNDTVDAGPGNDIVLGSWGHDDIDGGPGNDLILGQSGDDTADGGEGNDWMFASWGDDEFAGGPGNDFIFGDRGDDELDGGDDRDYLDGGRDDDNCINGERVRRCERNDPGGGTPGISVAKNDPGPDTAPAVPAGADAPFEITIENIGDTDLVNISVSDPAVTGCEQAVPDLAPGATHDISCSAATDLGTTEVANEVTVTGESPAGDVVSASDSSTVPVLTPDISLTKLTNGANTDVDPVPEIAEGDPVEWAYIVENTGQGDLTGLVVDDPDLPGGVSISCPATDVPEGGSVTCTAADLAVAGPYANTATASADNAGGLTVSASDSSAYEGIPALVGGSGVVMFVDGGGIGGADVTASFEGGPPDSTTTGFGGDYDVTVEGLAPGQFRVDVETTVGGVPLSSTRYGYVPDGDDTVVLDPIELPNPAVSQLFDLGGGDFWDFDEVRIFGLPPEVVSVYGEAFDEETEPNAFPGLVGDDSGNAFNSTVFAWLVALDGAGNEVTSFASPVTVRLRIPPNQHGDVFDLTPGNGVIDLPMYSFDEVSGDWVTEATGIVTNSAGTPYAEADAADIRDGNYGAFSVYAEYETTHFSWWNVDYKKTDFPGSGDPGFFDFGDAGDTYPTTLAQDGSRHSDPNRLWMGQWADLESDANTPDSDEFDDGLLSLDPISVRVNNWDIVGETYLNVLIDRNDDGDWTDPGEWAVQNAVTATPTFKGKSYDTTESWDPNTEGALRLTVTAVPLVAYDGTGEFALGETEDYLDPPDGDVFVNVRGGGAVTSDVGGIDCPATLCDTSVVGGSVVTLTATADPDRDFLGWSGDCFDRGTNPTCSVAVDPNDNVFVSAVFSEQFERVFSLAPGSPTLAANGWSPADVLFIDDAGVVTRLFSTADLGLDSGDDIDALDFFFDGPPPPITPFDSVGIEYSATDSSAGAPGMQIEAEAACALGDLGGDVWGLGGEGGGEFATTAVVDPYLPFQWVDEDGVICGTNQAFSAAGLVPGDEIDGWSRIDLADPGDPYYSLAPGSPTLGLLGLSEADILETEAGVAVLYLAAGDIGLVAGDDVDALAGDLGAGGGSFVQISLAPGSPTLSANSWNAAMILGYSGGLFPYYFEDTLGLLETDDLDALEQNGFFFGQS